MIDSMKKARHSNTIVHGRMLCTRVTDALHMTGSKTFFSSDQHHHWRATHYLQVTGISSPSAAHQIKKLPLTYGILSVRHRQVLFMTGCQWLGLPVAVNR
jgi:hypothetical protein